MAKLELDFISFLQIGDFGLVTTHGLDEDTTEVGSSGDAPSGLCLPVITSEALQHTAEVGTEAYMSPEQIARRTYDHKVRLLCCDLA